MEETYYIAWWNVENLFDEEDSPRRSDKLTRALGKSIQGWTAELRDRKIGQLASVIAQMSEGAGPDLLGICEVENEFVVGRLRDSVNTLLPGRSYEVAHADTRDERGIDVAFLYDSSLFTAPVGERFQHVVMRRTATREIFQVTFHTHRGHTLTVFGNHWPSRSGGQLESAGYRAIAGETLAYFHQRVWEVTGADTPVLVMGDFNDEPFDPSLVQYALSTRQPDDVTRARQPLLWNLMWHALGEGQGSLFYEGHPNLLDQFLVDRNLMSTDGALRADPGSVGLVCPPQQGTGHNHPVPIPFGGLGKKVNPDGYSDHFPIAMRLTEVS